MTDSSKDSVPKKVYKHQRLYGDVLITQPKIYSQFIFVIFGLVMVGLIFLVMGTYTKSTRVEGVITTAKGLTKIIATAPGTIKQQLIKGGDNIVSGDVLYNISTKRQSNENQDLDADVLTQLFNSKSLLETKLESHGKLSTLKYKLYAKEITEKEESLVHLLKGIGYMVESILISNKALNKIESLLSEGDIVETGYDDLKLRLLNAQTTKEDMELRIVTTRGDIEQLKYQLRAHPVSSKIELNEIRQSINKVEQQIIQTSKNRNYRIVSSVDGIIATNLTKVGETVLTGQTLMTILPTESLFMAELYVPSESIGLVEKGQKVSMRYSAFPYEHYGLYDGTVSDISKVISRPNELNKVSHLTQSVYIVTVNLASQTVNVDEKQLPLQVGMAISASITLESRSLIQWILAPIYSLRGRL